MCWHVSYTCSVISTGAGLFSWAVFLGNTVRDNTRTHAHTNTHTHTYTHIQGVPGAIAGGLIVKTKHAHIYIHTYRSYLPGCPSLGPHCKGQFTHTHTHTHTGVTFLGAIPVGLIVKDSRIISAFSTVCVAFMLTFGGLIGLFAFLPAPVQGELVLCLCWQW